jgi:endogenous inhibitor of DNA gyrase (YacG/DUF329 family)
MIWKDAAMPSESRARDAYCPRCGKPRIQAFRPFCSRGCRDRDLLSWFGEDYRMAVVEAAEDVSSDENEAR